MNKTLLISAAAAVAAAPVAHSQIVVAAPGVEARQDVKNIFDQIKYAWEQAQWADKLATLHSTLTTVREQLETANLVKQAIGDPVAAIALIDNGLFSDYLQDSGIGDTLTDLAGIAEEGVQLSATIQELFEPIDISGWTDVSASFEGVASFRDPADPLRRFRAVENAYSALRGFASPGAQQAPDAQEPDRAAQHPVEERQRRRRSPEARRFAPGGGNGPYRPR